jgi:hypothetical protein
VGARTTAIWKLQAALKCRWCKQALYALPVHVIKLTMQRDITPRVWVYPDEGRRGLLPAAL